jgi:hypothetical protein
VLHFYIVVLRWCYVDGQNVTHQNVDGQNVDGQNVDGQNFDSQNVVLIEMSRLYLELTLSTLFIKCVISDSRHFGTYILAIDATPSHPSVIMLNLAKVFREKGSLLSFVYKFGQVACQRC